MTTQNATRRRTALLAAISVAIPLAFNPPASAQDIPAEASDAPVVTEAAPPPEAPEASGKDDGTTAAIAALEEKMARQEAALNARIDELEAARQEAELAAIPTGFEPSFRIFGFFDLTFNKLFPKKNGFFEGMIQSKPSFFMQNLNLYFRSDLTPTLSTLAELRFTFMPNGDQISPELEGFSEYERVDTTVQDLYSSEFYRLNGVKIERVHLTWQPRDWLGIIAGRFLTPYGIWNVEHGSPVIIAVRPPYSQVAHFLPLAQTGLQAFGRANVAGHLDIGYALTFSNGRGPMDEVHDLDSNKAGGLRLQILYDSPQVKFTLGGYGYLGAYTDTMRRIESVSPFDGVEKTTERYREYVGSLDALLEVKGLRLQSELVRRLVKYEVRPLKTFADRESSINGYPADYVATSAYLLVAYTLPLRRLIGDRPVTPYMMGEYINLNDTLDSNLGINVEIGINFKPVPYVALKLETYSVYFPIWHQDEVDAGTKKDALEHFWGLSAQMAVSF